ncbi:MAG TPA: ABC transporter substrate-binding protein [Micromonosporaceae bacterium]|nr:ABC transporter substrate-binding protein [Micromonosporaceae bacterium]
MRKYRIPALLAAVALAASGCGGGDEEPKSGANAVSGEITVLTQRTDLVDNVFQEYKKKFEAKYPGTSVKFEAITDYEGEVRIRMNTKDYGDVLLIPGSITQDQLPTYFEPLGTVDELAGKYRFVKSEQTFEGKSYGIAITGNAQGLVYNKKIWTQAGITAAPKTPEEFIAALKTIKEKTGAIPLYTNYKDGWPLTQLIGGRGSVSGDPDATIDLANDDAPWSPGKEQYILDTLLWDAVKEGLTEPDPTTTNWEQSKSMIGTGKVATMVLGSWAVVQMQAAAPNKADISYMPYPVQANGKFHSAIGGDYKNAINVNSDNKATARAWLDWFANESGYAISQGGISPVLADPMPETLADFKTAGVEYVEMSPEPKGKEGLVLRIDKASEIAINDPKYRQRIVDAARGAKKETKEEIFADLNKRWAQAKAKTS